MEFFTFSPQGLAPRVCFSWLKILNWKRWLSSRILRLSQSLGIQVILMFVAVIWQTLLVGFTISSLQLDSSLTDLLYCLGQQCARSRTCTFFKTPLRLQWPQVRVLLRKLRSHMLRSAAKLNTFLKRNSTFYVLCILPQLKKIVNPANSGL